MTRTQALNVLVGGVLVLAGYLLGSLGQTNAAYASAGSGVTVHAASVPENGGAAFFVQGVGFGGNTRWFVNSKGKWASGVP